MGTQLPLPQKGRSPQFSAHICCGQMAGWIKIPLGREVGLSPCDIVLDGDPAIPPATKGAQQPPSCFQPMSIVATVAQYSTVVQSVEKTQTCVVRACAKTWIITAWYDRGKIEAEGYKRSETNAPVERPDGEQKLHGCKARSSRQSRLESWNGTSQTFW